MTAVDWLWILHPLMAVVLIYPLIGMVLRLGVQTRARRQKTNPKLPPSVGRSHSDLGRWLAAAVVGIVLVALTVSIATKAPLADFNGGAARGAQLLLGGDLGCLFNIAGRIKREGFDTKVYHVAEVLAGMTDVPAIGDAAPRGASPGAPTSPR